MYFQVQHLLLYVGEVRSILDLIGDYVAWTHWYYKTIGSKIGNVYCGLV